MAMHVWINLIIVCFGAKIVRNQLIGHLQPLGSHRRPLGKILEESREITSEKFYKEYASLNKPIVMRGLLKDSVPITKWNDYYLLNKFGHETVTVDLSKRGRAEESISINFREFLKSYISDQEYYMIQTLPDSMQQEMTYPRILDHCNVYTRLQDFVLWFSSGGTKSKLHYDNVENFYCQIDGNKTWFMVDPQHGKDKIPIDNETGAYSTIDVDRVDMIINPAMQNVDYFLTTTKPGDCIYVPCNWFHQVSSATGRNMAVNIWWAPTSAQNQICSFTKDISVRTVLSDMQFYPGEWFKYILLKLLQDSGAMSFVEIQKLVVDEHSGRCLIDQEDFIKLDSNNDQILTFEDVIDIDAGDILNIFDRSSPGAVNTNGVAEQVISCASTDRHFNDEL